MDFQYVLADLLAKVEGALGVLFLDYDGETVEAMGCTNSIYDIKVLGAYQGIFLGKAKTFARELNLGTCEETIMQIGREKFVTRALPDGYYITLILGEEASEGIARRELQRAGKKISEILF